MSYDDILGELTGQPSGKRQGARGGVGGRKYPAKRVKIGAPIQGRSRVFRAATQAELEMAVMNPRSAPPDVILDDQWSGGDCMPAQPHVEFNGSYVPGDAHTGTQPGLPDTDRAGFLFKNMFRQAMVMMPNTKQNTGVTDKTAVNCYTAYYERRAGADNPAFPIRINDDRKFLRPMYAKPSTTGDLTGSGIPSTWSMHGPYQYPAHDNKEVLTTNRYGFWINATTNADGTPSRTTTQAGQVRIKQSWVVTAGADSTYELWTWDGDDFVPYKNSSGVTISAIFNNGSGGGPIYFTDTGGNSFCVEQSGYYAIKYIGNSNAGTRDAGLAAAEGNVQYQYIDGLCDGWAIMPSPDHWLVRDMQKRVKPVGSAFRCHQASPNANLTGIGTVLLCKGGDWDPVSDFMTTTTPSPLGIVGLPSVGGTLFNTVSSEDAARDWDPKVGFHAFVPFGGDSNPEFEKYWQFDQAGVSGTWGYPIIPDKPFIVWVESIPKITIGATATAVVQEFYLESYYNYELHNVNDWLPRFFPNVSYEVVQAVVKLFSGSNINYVMDNPWHWQGIKNFIKRTTGIGGDILRIAAPIASMFGPTGQAIGAGLSGIGGITDAVNMAVS